MTSCFYRILSIMFKHFFFSLIHSLIRRQKSDLQSRIHGKKSFMLRFVLASFLKKTRCTLFSANITFSFQGVFHHRRFVLSVSWRFFFAPHTKKRKCRKILSHHSACIQFFFLLGVNERTLRKHKCNFCTHTRDAELYACIRSR